MIQSWNAGAEKMYGYSSEEAIGQTTASLLRGNVTPEERKRILNEIFEKGFWKGEKIQRDKQGNSIYVLSSITLIRNSIGESIGLVGINSDVTSQNKLKAQITQFNTQLEKQVKEKTQELQTVFDRITDAFIALDENWTYTYLNEKAAELHGRSAEELIGKKIWDENPDVENEPFYELLHSAFINQKAIGQRVYSPSKKMWFENHIFPSENGVSVYYRDVTAIKKREDEKEKITDRITTILDNAFAGCIMFSHDWIYLYINRIAASYGETTPEELTGKSFLEVYPRVIETEMFRQMEKCMISRKAEHVEVPYLFKDGSTRWYELSMKPVEEGLFVLSNDITERKNAERKSLTLTEQLKEISSSLPGVVYQFAMDKDGKMKFTFVSEGMERLTGMSLEACYADAMNTFKLVDPDYLPGLYKSIEESVLSMNPWFYIFPITDLHGTKRWIRGNSVPRKSDDGGIIWNGTLIEISELKLTEAELIASESRYRSLIENASDLIFVLDENGIIREVNSKACTCLDLNEKDLVGYSLAELVFKRNNSDFSLSENKFKESNSFIENIILKQRSGAEVFVEANFNLLDDKRRLVIARDITERKKAEEAKLQTDRRYTLLFERNLAGVYRTTLAGKILDCNEAFARMMGYDSKAELLTHHTYDLYNKSEDRDKFIADLILNSVLTNYESKLKRRDGSEVYLLENVSFIKNSEFGSDIIEGIAIDMTDRVEAGEQLQVAKRRFQNLVENISGVYWVLDLYTLKILYVSPSYETITGKKCEDLCLDFHDFLNSVHPLDKPSLVWKYESEARDSKNDLEFRIIRTDGSIRWIQAKTNVIKKANGELIEYGYAEDITDSKLADEATRLSEQKYKLMFEKNPLPMWIISAE
ncbi:MAG TPA: PAS domain S-box protein, partial [Bacteroidia bacterium]|nr:PAS domain S-box protein [Bacteroidia bacterium]